ncbi:WD40 repeat-like protein [Ascobolus immersus RN42]|uniref:WD40 repeat-like protein n=1 Tax=Ascobolus immersus RN42 TaxID=1160509 RepID=A0A3N4HJZ3_ASCIM|nr:WD40 repeat-like protein [Ascobolus immersus RN42]
MVVPVTPAKKKQGGNPVIKARADGRIPLTPSPKVNRMPTTPPRKTSKGEKSVYGGNLTSHFAKLQLSPKSRAKKAAAEKESAASSSRKAVASSSSSSSSTTLASSSRSKSTEDLHLDLGVSDFALAPTERASSVQPSSSAGSTAAKKKSKTTIRVNQGDRFIPARPRGSPRNAGMSGPSSSSGNRPGSAGSNHPTLEGSVFGSNNLDNSDNDDDAIPKKKEDEAYAYENALGNAVGINVNQRILVYKPAPPESSKPVDLRSQYNRAVKPNASAQFRRRILTAPDRVLDAPGLVDDYYLNLLDWSSDNQIAIGLERSVYVWNGESGTVTELLECKPDDYIASVKWSHDGAHIAVGLGTGDVQIWDAEEGTRLRTMTGHTARVGSLSWNRGILSTGSRTGLIFNHDVRIAQHKVAELVSHTSEVCGLEWRSDGAQLASGGNDNLVNIWDARSLEAPKWTKTNHKAAVKALAWCPWQLNLLATGGGSYDRHIHFWNSTSGARVNSIDAGSQVTSLRWSTTYREIVSCHGFPDNQLAIWSYPSLVRNVEIPAHETRVLHSALSPDGQTLATAASDESLKFWKVFERKVGTKTQQEEREEGGKMEKRMTIR